MELYKNLGRCSSIIAYDIGADFIRIRFNSGRIYTYSNQSAGITHVVRMKQYAQSGYGLNSYIQKYVKNGYVK